MDAISADVAALLEDGAVAIWFATADAEHVPQTARSMGAKVGREAGIVWLYIPVEQGVRALANLREGSHIAATFCRIYDYRAVQVKGTLASMRPCTDEDRPWIARYHQLFSTAGARIGIPLEACTRLAYWPAVALEVFVRELYSQTPGVNAGARL